ncbi:MAG: LamG domain-containing protein, partial [Candidatus Odinarchaeota archaeon]|nr:LamG domain-containing protein [Candidatus Odinarchaeota archaeon]
MRKSKKQILITIFLFMLILSALTPAATFTNKLQGVDKKINATNNIMEAAADQSNNYTNFQNTTNIDPWTQDQFYFTNDPNIEQNQHIDMPDRLLRYAPDVNDTRLITWFRFNEGAGGYTIDWKQGINATLNSPTYVRGYIGTALNFSGSDYIVASDTSLKIYDDVTIEFWLKLEDYPTLDYATIIAMGASGETEDTNILYGVLIMTDGDIVLAHEYGAGVNQFSRFDTNLVLGRWYHIIGERNSTAKTWTLLLDGVIFGEATYTTNPEGGANANLYMGGNVSTAVNCVLDEVRIYNSLLTIEEGLWHYSISLYYDGQKDMMGRDSSGSVTSYIRGVFGTASEFDGVDDYIYYSDDDGLDVYDGMTIILFIYIPQFVNIY